MTPSDSLLPHTRFDARVDLERRISALEVQMIRVAAEAKMAWEAEQERSRREYQFWWNALRAVVVLTIGVSWGLVLFGKP